ncbi:MAG: hypothetical protein LBH00_10085, partial [Planctomycetaceae bacterium]|nr:hypothetical protein [Planctomycetaceae bacterium]
TGRFDTFPAKSENSQILGNIGNLRCVFTTPPTFYGKKPTTLQETCQIPWDKLKRNDIDVLLKFFDDLPPDKRNETEVVLRHVHVLSCEQGTQTLGEAADELRPDETWADIYLSDKNLYSKAMSAYLFYREIFNYDQLHRDPLRFSFSNTG